MNNLLLSFLLKRTSLYFYVLLVHGTSSITAVADQGQEQTCTNDIYNDDGSCYVNDNNSNNKYDWSLLEKDLDNYENDDINQYFDNGNDDGKGQAEEVCTLYMAKSSIPNAGWGMYTGIDLDEEVIIGPKGNDDSDNSDDSVRKKYNDIIISLFNPHDEFQIVRQTTDPESPIHDNYFVPRSLMEQYEWLPRWGGVDKECEGYVNKLIIPSFGMLANSHTGLINCENSGNAQTYLSSRTTTTNPFIKTTGTDNGGSSLSSSSSDPGIGAFSYLYDLHFTTSQKIKSGMEIFVEYGDNWFQERSEIFGSDFPLSWHWPKADTIIKDFFHLHDNILERWIDDDDDDDDDNINSNSVCRPTKTKYSDEQKQLWIDHRKEEVDIYDREENEYDDDGQSKSALLRALPMCIEDAARINHKFNGKSAMLSVPNVQRSTAWLQRNGYCIDNMYVSKSTIPFAGNGAFATRSILKGSVVSPMPLIHMHRNHMMILTTDYNDGTEETIQRQRRRNRRQHEKDKMGKEDDDDYDDYDDDDDDDEQIMRDTKHEIYYKSNQLLLNYCYSHPSTSLIFFPYSPIVNSINHYKTNQQNQEGEQQQQEPNVVVRWSKTMMDDKNKEWFKVPTEELLEIHDEKAGLIMELVALRDIKKDEEILLDYGMKWNDQWTNHVQNWANNTDINTNTEISGRQKQQRQYKPAQVFNEEERILRTYKESPSYPSNIMVHCYIPKKKAGLFTDDDDGEYDEPDYDDPDLGHEYTNDYEWHEVQGMFHPNRYTDTTRPCVIVDRNKVGVSNGDDENNNVYEYTIRVEGNERNNFQPVTFRNVPRHAIIFFDQEYTTDHYLRDAFRREIDLPDNMIPKAWRDIERREKNRLIAKKQSLEECQMFMAESAIPNSGLGTYTGIDLPKDSNIFYSDVTIQVEDFEEHTRLRHQLHGINPSNETIWLMDSYYWNPQHLHTLFEAEEVTSIVPGMGMLANSHTGLVNAELRPPSLDDANLSRYVDPGAGGSSNWHGVQYISPRDVKGGMELFVEYGDHWFESRPDLGLIPLSYDFLEADEILETYWKAIGGDINTEFAKDLWKNKTKESDSRPRLRAALPKTLTDVERLMINGITTAMDSVPNVQRSKNWLNENGRCLDNIKPGISTIRQAAHGAFATRPIKKGDVIAPLPMVHLHRRYMEMYGFDEDRPNSKPYFVGFQQLLNYCYGHPKSNMILFPYSPQTNYLNHHVSNNNAELQWSSLSNNNYEKWSEKSVEDIMQIDHAGLIMELVATRDISEGEEIFLNYGPRWESAWRMHVREWQRPGRHNETFWADPHNPPTSDYVPPTSFNDYLIPVRTLDEEESDPYPENLITVCFVRHTVPAKGKHGEQVHEWRYTEGMYDTMHDAEICDILVRNEQNEDLDPEYAQGSISPPFATYTARVGDRIVTNMPRRAILFADVRYTSDLFLLNGFRHQIDIPDHLFPKAWMDLE